MVAMVAMAMMGWRSSAHAARARVAANADSPSESARVGVWTDARGTYKKFPMRSFPKAVLATLRHWSLSAREPVSLPACVQERRW